MGTEQGWSAVTHPYNPIGIAVSDFMHLLSKLAKAEREPQLILGWSNWRLPSFS